MNGRKRKLVGEWVRHRYVRYGSETSSKMGVPSVIACCHIISRYDAASWRVYFGNIARYPALLDDVFSVFVR